MENQFSSRIKELRTTLNMTQAAFAKSIGTSQNALSAYENKDRIPSYDILMTIATTYNISIDWLCGLNNNPQLRKEITTYADILKIFVELCSVKYTADALSPGEFVVEPSLVSASSNIHFVIRNDENFNNFFSEWKKMHQLLIDKTIDKELYELWLEKELAKYNRPINGFPF